jgi:small subunit ribosomal protein S9
MAKKLTKKASRPQKIIKRVVSPVARPKASVAGESTKTQNFVMPAGEYTEGVGRRKVATARVRIYDQVGEYVVNNQLAAEYFNTVPMALNLLNKPFELTGTKGKFSITATVSGSGTNSQLDAVVHGLSRALIQFDPTFRTLLKQEGLLTRDSRLKETRKPGRGGKARRKRQSPKR